MKAEKTTVQFEFISIASFQIHSGHCPRGHLPVASNRFCTDKLDFVQQTSLFVIVCKPCNSQIISYFEWLLD